jgi:hypothetical protein
MDANANILQHPEENMLLVGETVSRYQGWVRAFRE